MIGVLFTDFVEMMEKEYSPAIADAILTPPGLASGGVYTSVGVYEYREFNQLVERLAKHVKKDRSEVLLRFGRFHFHRLLRLYPHLVSQITDTFGLLERVNKPIHATVTQLHENSEVPYTELTFDSATHARLNYRSKHPLSEIAEGLIQAATEHYGDHISITRSDHVLNTSGESVCFNLSKPPLQ